MSIHFLLDDSTVFLLSPWKPVLIFIAFIAWGWLFSTHLDKDAQKVRLNVMKWNGIQMTCGAVALFIMYFGGVFYIAYPIGLVVMVAPILLYWKVRNEEVPEEREFNIKAETFKKAFERRKTAKAQGKFQFILTAKTDELKSLQKILRHLKFTLLLMKSSRKQLQIAQIDLSYNLVQKNAGLHIWLMDSPLILPHYPLQQAQR